MKKFLSVLAVVCLMLLVLSSAAFADEIEDVEAGNAYIPEDTVINLILLDKLDSNVNKKGDTVNFELKDDLAVENIVIVPKGTKFSGALYAKRTAAAFLTRARLSALSLMMCCLPTVNPSALSRM